MPALAAPRHTATRRAAIPVGTIHLAEAVLDGPEERRPQAALALADALVATYPAVPLPAIHLRRLDAACPDLLEGPTPAHVASAVAVCAALSGRLTSPVRTPLRRLLGSEDPRLAVAAHLTTLLVEGLVLSAQHVQDLLAVIDSDAAAERADLRSPRARAVAVVPRLARAIAADA